MEAALKNYDEEWPDYLKNDASPRMEARFTEIYELILHNNTMVESELKALLRLIEKKYGEIKQRKRIRRKTILTSCCVCKKIRIDDIGPIGDRWMEVEDFLKREMDILLSSTYCPKCAQAAQKDLQVRVDRLKA